MIYKLASGRSSRGDLRERVGSSDQSGPGGGGSETTLSPGPGGIVTTGGVLPQGNNAPPPVPFSIPAYPPPRFLDDNAVWPSLESFNHHHYHHHHSHLLSSLGTKDERVEHLQQEHGPLILFGSFPPP